MNNQLPPESEWKWRYYVAEIGVECFRIAKVWNDQPAANLTLEDNPKPLRLVTGGIEKFIESFIRDRLALTNAGRLKTQGSPYRPFWMGESPY